MPTYDYLCDTCGAFERRRPMAESSELATCPICHASASRMLTAPRLNLMSSANRNAEARNEKSAHAPEVVQTLQSGQREIPEVAKHRNHQHNPRPPTRPWMMGH